MTRESTLGFPSNESAVLDAYVRELLLYQLDMTKVLNTINVCGQEIKEYEDLQSDMEYRIKSSE